MKILEKFLAFSIPISLVLKFNLIPGGTTLTFWSIGILAGIYYPLGFFLFSGIRLRRIFKKDSYERLSLTKIITSIVTGLGLSIILIGSLFKFLNLAGGDKMLITGLIINSIVLGISIINFRRKSDTYYKTLFIRIAAVGSFGIIMIFISEHSIIKFQYRSHPDYVKAYMDYLNKPESEELRRKKETEYYKVILTEEDFKRYEKSVDR